MLTFGFVLPNSRHALDSTFTGRAHIDIRKEVRTMQTLSQKATLALQYQVTT
jgi:hypothetical protein